MAKSGPMGIKSIATWLNERGYRTRKGARFGVGTIGSILTNKTYIGNCIFNKRSSRTQKEKPENEQVKIEVPAIISKEEFKAVQIALHDRNPLVTPPRVVSGPILLTGVARCASCGGAMTLRTGTSKSGKVHKYYTCSTSARQGKTACHGHSTAMEKLDSIVTDHLVEQLFQPRRLTKLLSIAAERRARKALEADERIDSLHAEVFETEEKLQRLYRMVEDGNVEIDDILKERLTALKLHRDRALTALERLKRNAGALPSLDLEAIEHFGMVMREKMKAGEITFRKAYVRSVVDRIEVDDNSIRIFGLGEIRPTLQ